MKIATKYHGEIDIEEIIRFENGIPGFEDEREFAILPLFEDQTFFVLQSIVTAPLAFIITNPFIHFKNYEFDLTAETISQLQIKNEEDVQTYTILTVKEDIRDTTANLLAPIIVNTKEKIAKQIILHETKYETKHLLYNQTIPAGQEE